MDFITSLIEDTQETLTGPVIYSTYERSDVEEDDPNFRQAMNYLCMGDVLDGDASVYYRLANHGHRDRMKDYFKKVHADLGLNLLKNRQEIAGYIINDADACYNNSYDFGKYTRYRRSFWKIALADDYAKETIMDMFSLDEQEQMAYLTSRVAHKRTLSNFGWGHVYWNNGNSSIDNKIEDLKFAIEMAKMSKTKSVLKENFPECYNILQKKRMINEVFRFVNKDRNDG